ncbi:MAG: PAS domain S-box protein, partial [Gammaproteobacteria bacterium]|nr:PAS domain S-box protein [Gammaproteobacteria bacterium]
MKQNLPVTNTETKLADNEYIISATDAKGIITRVNDVFTKVSGYSQEELIGKNHNIVRHPDMPPAAFEDL